MDRRSVVKHLVIASGSLITLPFWMSACNTGDKKAGKEPQPGTHLSSFSPDEQAIIAGTADAIIPPGVVIATGATADTATTVSTPIGALSMGVDKYLQKLIDDCYERPVQDNIKQQLKTLDTSAKTDYGNSFAVCTLPQRQALLLKMQASGDQGQKTFFELIKNETIHGFSTSQKVMEDYYHYKVAPGHYYGCVTIKA